MKFIVKEPIFIYIGFMLIVFLSIPILAQGNIIFEVEDPLNDDYGPGTYQYPTNEAFHGEGFFDITYFSIEDLGKKYRLNFTFQNLTDPWNSKYGFSLPLIQLYFGKKGSGSTELYQEGANIRLDTRYPWNRLLKISGWWVRAYTPEDNHEMLDFWDVENNPANVEDALVEVKDNQISIHLDREIIGDLENAYVYILVGSYDPFGQDHFRDIKNSPSSWYFSDSSNENLKFAPRILDIIVPAHLEQEKLLSNFAEDYPVILPLIITPPAKTVIYLPPLVLALLILVFFIVNKFRPGSYNK